jgi:hypothetical protein
MNDTGHLATSRISKYAAVLWAVSFVFFLVYSAPHRVHHFFEQVPSPSQHHSPDDQNKSKHDHKTPNASDCVFQASANRCAANLTTQIDTPTLTESLEILAVFAPSRSPQSSLSARFQIRSPPQL